VATGPIASTWGALATTSLLCAGLHSCVTHVKCADRVLGSRPTSRCGDVRQNDRMNTLSSYYRTSSGEINAHEGISSFYSPRLHTDKRNELIAVAGFYYSGCGRNDATTFFWISSMQPCSKWTNSPVDAAWMRVDAYTKKLQRWGSLEAGCCFILSSSSRCSTERTMFYSVGAAGPNQPSRWCGRGGDGWAHLNLRLYV
jgi:hypothetical protein